MALDAKNITIKGKRGGRCEQDAGGQRRHHPTAQSCLPPSHRTPCCPGTTLGENLSSFSQPNLPSQVGTSAGVIVTLGLPHITATTTKLPSPPPLSGEQKCQLKSSILKFHRDTVICTDIENVEGNPHGHTGHVRFLTAVEMSNPSTASSNMIANSSSASNLMSSPSITSSLMSNSMPSSASLTSSSTTASTDLGQPFGQAVGSSGADTGRALRPGPRISPGGQGRILVSHYSLFWKSS